MKQLLMAGLGCLCLISMGCGTKTAQSTTTSAAGKTSSAPSGQDAANAKVALVRFVDAVPGGHSALAFGDNTLFSDVAYKTVTPYKEVAGERHDFKLTTDRPARQSKPVTNSEGLTNGVRYTVVAALDKTGMEKLDVINDDLSRPADGKAKMRVINASATEVNVYAPESRNGSRTEGTADRAMHPARTAAYTDEEKWFGGVNSVSSTTFKDVKPYDGQVDIVPANQPKHARSADAAHLSLDVKPGEIYTVVVAGGTRKYPLEAVKIDDHLDAPSTTAPANR